jgi:hypothetical protein
MSSSSILIEELIESETLPTNKVANNEREFVENCIIFYGF